MINNRRHKFYCLMMVSLYSNSFIWDIYRSLPGSRFGPLALLDISLDKNKSSWVRAIEDDGLNWNHVSNLKFWDEPIARQYNVESIPATFILDATGKVIAKDLRGAYLRNKVASLLAK